MVLLFPQTPGQHLHNLVDLFHAAFKPPQDWSGRCVDMVESYVSRAPVKEDLEDWARLLTSHFQPGMRKNLHILESHAC